MYCMSAFLLLSNSFLGLAQNDDIKDWNQFRGMYRNGVSEESGLIDKWPEKGPELIWKKELGTGFSEVVVTADKLFTAFGTEENGKSYDFIGAFDLKTGKEIWKTKLDSLYIEKDGWGHGTRSTPAVDKDYIYALSGYGKLSAFSAKDGKLIWTVDLIKELKSKLPYYGYGTSPLITGNLVIVETGGVDDKNFVAFDKKNGKIVWAKGKGNSAYNSPLIVELEKKTNIVFANDTMLYSFDEKGNTNWAYRMPFDGPTAMPVFIEPDKFFISEVNVTGSVVIQVKGNKISKIMESNIMKNVWSSSCYFNGYIYGFNNAKMQCISAKDGELKWVKRGLGKGSLIIVGNKLLMLSDKGKLVMADAKPDAYSEKGSIQALDGKSWTAPSFYNGNVYLRNLTQIACYKLK